LGLLTKKLLDDLREQSSYMSEKGTLMALAKVYHPDSDWNWYLICFKNYYEEEKIYCLLDGESLEFGFVSLYVLNDKVNEKEFQLDKDFEPVNIFKLKRELKEMAFI